MDKKIKKVAIEAVKKSGDLAYSLWKNFDRKKIMMKPQCEVVTEADLVSEKNIIGSIRKNFPLHNIISEESGWTKTDSDYTWVLDPIDGTTSFTMHSPLWCISLAVACRDELILGIVYAPVLKEFFIAEKGKGAKLNGKKITVSGTKGGKLLNTYCHARNIKDIKRMLKYYSYQKSNCSNCQQLGSAAIELAYTACGRVDNFVAFGANSWDVAAGALLVREAGGRVTDFAGRGWNLTSRDILASNALVHGDIIKIMKKLKV